MRLTISTLVLVSIALALPLASAYAQDDLHRYKPQTQARPIPTPPKDGVADVKDFRGTKIGTQTTATAGQNTTVTTHTQTPKTSGGDINEVQDRKKEDITEVYHRNDAGNIDKITTTRDNEETRGTVKDGFKAYRKEHSESTQTVNPLGGYTTERTATETTNVKGEEHVWVWKSKDTYDAAGNLIAATLVVTKDGVLDRDLVWDPVNEWMNDVREGKTSSGSPNSLGAVVGGGNGAKVYYYFEGTIVSTSGCTGVFYRSAPRPGSGSNLLGNMWLRGGKLYATNGLGEISASPEYAGVLRSDGSFYVRSKPNYAGQRSQINGHLSAKGQISGKWDRVFDGYCVDHLRITRGHGPSPASLQRRRPTTRSRSARRE